MFIYCIVVLVNKLSLFLSLSLHFLKLLKRLGAGLDDLLCFYKTDVRPVLEYACPAWHSSLMTGQSKALEAIQRRAMMIIFAHSDYEMSLVMTGLQGTRSRHGVLSSLSGSSGAASCVKRLVCTIFCRTNATLQ